ncbi:hypothetical protein PCE1_004686 [Barthelona sp. PCE]
MSVLKKVGEVAEIPIKPSFTSKKAWNGQLFGYKKNSRSKSVREVHHFNTRGLPPSRATTISFTMRDPFSAREFVTFEECDLVRPSLDLSMLFMTSGCYFAVCSCGDGICSNTGFLHFGSSPTTASIINVSCTDNLSHAAIIYKNNNSDVYDAALVNVADHVVFDAGVHSYAIDPNINIHPSEQALVLHAAGDIISCQFEPVNGEATHRFLAIEDEWDIVDITFFAGGSRLAVCTERTLFVIDWSSFTIISRTVLNSCTTSLISVADMYFALCADKISLHDVSGELVCEIMESNVVMAFDAYTPLLHTLNRNSKTINTFDLRSFVTVYDDVPKCAKIRRTNPNDDRNVLFENAACSLYEAGDQLLFEANRCTEVSHHLLLGEILFVIDRDGFLTITYARQDYVQVCDIPYHPTSAAFNCVHDNMVFIDDNDRKRTFAFNIHSVTRIFEIDLLPGINGVYRAHDAVYITAPGENNIQLFCFAIDTDETQTIELMPGSKVSLDGNVLTYTVYSDENQCTVRYCDQTERFIVFDILLLCNSINNMIQNNTMPESWNVPSVDDIIATTATLIKAQQQEFNTKRAKILDLISRLEKTHIPQSDDVLRQLNSFISRFEGLMSSDLVHSYATLTDSVGMNYIVSVKDEMSEMIRHLGAVMHAKHEYDALIKELPQWEAFNSIEEYWRNEVSGKYSVRDAKIVDDCISRMSVLEKKLSFLKTPVAHLMEMQEVYGVMTEVTLGIDCIIKFLGTAKTSLTQCISSQPIRRRKAASNVPYVIDFAYLTKTRNTLMKQKDYLEAFCQNCDQKALITRSSVICNWITQSITEIDSIFADCAAETTVESLLVGTQLAEISFSEDLSPTVILSTIYLGSLLYNSRSTFQCSYRDKFSFKAYYVDREAVSEEERDAAFDEIARNVLLRLSDTSCALTDLLGIRLVCSHDATTHQTYLRFVVLEFEPLGIPLDEFISEGHDVCDTIPSSILHAVASVHENDLYFMSLNPEHVLVYYSNNVAFCKLSISEQTRLIGPYAAPETVRKMKYTKKTEAYAAAALAIYSQREDPDNTRHIL